MRTRPFAALLSAAVLLPAAASAQPQPPAPTAPPAPLAQPVPPPAAPVPPAATFPATPLPGAQPTPPGMPPPAGYPPPAPSPGAWAPPPPAASPEAPPPPEEIPGVTAKGLPLAMRGGIIADLAGISTNASAPIASIDLLVRIPVLPHTFVDADLPIGFGALGNPMVGMHHVFRPADKLWISLGGAFGFPLIHVQGFESFAFANGLWEAERFIQENVPFAVHFGLEGHAGIAEFRVELAPVWGISINSDVNHFYSFDHAVEAQLGHTVGGGLRYQGVVVGTNNQALNTNDSRYQGAFEAFFRLYHDPIFLRLGLLMPLNDPLGAAFKDTWGFRATTGFNLD